MNRLKDKFCSIANAIRIRKGTTAPINCCDLEAEILSIGDDTPEYELCTDDDILALFV